MPRIVVYVLVVALAVTSIVWAIGVSNHIFLAREIGIYAVIFLVPVAAVCGSVWLIVLEPVWRRVLGVVMLLPSLAIWGASLLLVYNGFRIH